MNSLAPPPQLAYASLEQAKAAIDAHAQQEGYVVVVKRTKKVGNRKDGEVKALILACSQSNCPVIRTGPCQRVSSSRSTGCLFKASIRLQESGDWQVQVANGGHNHEPFAHKSAHPQGRALTEESRQVVLMLGRSGVTPGRIVTSLRQNNNVMATAQDVYNLRHAERNRMLAGRTPLVALLDGLTPGDYFSQFDVLQQLTHLLIISPSAKEICSKYSAGCIWLIDATYKTNKYGLPLLHIIGVTATNSTFTFAYCFMRNETSTDYLWAMRHVQEVFQGYGLQNAVLTFVTDRELALMSALSEMFPNASCLLCRWHISKNILAKQRTTFQTFEAWQEFNQAWNQLVAAKSMADFETQLAVMHATFPAVSMSYLETTWLVYKERFVAAFLRNKRHYGHVTTSRVESAHAALKKWISVSTGDLLSVDSAVRLACEGQLAVIVQQNAKQRAIVNMQLGPIFAEVMGKISVAGLRAAHRQYQQRLANNGECQGLLTSTMGFPCSHTFRHQLTPLSVNDFDKHWWLVQPTLMQIEVEAMPVGIETALKRIADEYNDAADHRKRVLLDYVLAVPETNIRDPVQVRTRGRPTRSTQRLPSQFEHVTAALDTPVRLRRCRICQETGHNARTCRQTPAVQAAPATPEAVDLELQVFYDSNL